MIKTLTLHIAHCLFCFALFTLNSAQAQDIHFSQYYASPLTLNPGMTGAFEGSYRLTAIGRSQWRSVTIPYQTFGASAEARNLTENKKAAAGLQFFYDQAGDSRFSTLHVNFSTSWKISLDNNQDLYIGIQPGIAQRTLNYDDLVFESDYLGIENAEVFHTTSLTYLNLGAGLFWEYKPRRNKTQANAGASLFNINRPEQSFFTNQDIRLDRRLLIHGSVTQQVTRRTWLIPHAMYARQGTFQELVVGGQVKYKLSFSPYENKNFYAGLSTRVGDAAIVSVGMDINDLYIGASYDFNYSNLVPASHFRGGLEFALIYLIPEKQDRKQYKTCPLFM
ncbi:PorP/SprF family type IX secretion system membrane protein [Cytophagaceae bacterium ABcell3]|nr:PorP/SprF family type IX secretion system membrane protein [Cytophagaceae bacterium ABcell3]